MYLIEVSNGRLKHSLLYWTDITVKHYTVFQKKRSKCSKSCTSALT